MSFENNKIPTLPTLPTLPIEIINEIKYKYGGLEHPTAKIIKNFPNSVRLHFTGINDPLRPPYHEFEISNYWWYGHGLMWTNGNFILG